MTITSEIPRIAAASRSSRVRTSARSPSASSAGSLTDPDSPRDPHISTTRTPASDSRASVPPHASDSSSGWAKIARTVLRALSGTMGLHEPGVYGDVLVDHPLDAEACDGAVVHALAIEREHA